MKIAILSDIHDNIWNLAPAMEAIRLAGAAAVICCGDLCSPFIIEFFRRGLSDPATQAMMPVHIVFGNNDGDRSAITKKAAASGQFNVYGEFVEFVVDETNQRLVERNALKAQSGGQDIYFSAEPPGVRIAVNHYDSLARPLAVSGVYQAVFYGHNHAHRCERSEMALALNPGALMGYNPITGKEVAASFAFYDTITGSVDWRRVGPAKPGNERREVLPYQVEAEALHL